MIDLCNHLGMQALKGLHVRLHHVGMLKAIGRRLSSFIALACRMGRRTWKAHHSVCPKLEVLTFVYEWKMSWFSQVTLKPTACVVQMFRVQQKFHLGYCVKKLQKKLSTSLRYFKELCAGFSVFSCPVQEGPPKLMIISR
jgi:hypothetical protein